MRKTPVNDDVMTTREAGEVLGVAVRTVQLWVESGVLPAWRTAGGHRRIARSAVRKLLAERAFHLAPSVQTAESNERSSAGKLKLLLVEDDPTLVELFGAIVAQWGLPLVLSTANNGFEGLLRIGEVNPDLVVTDLVMPGMDGFEMLRALKKAGSPTATLKVVVVSVLTPQEITERGGLPADVVYFPKPVHYDQLQDLARQIYEELYVKKEPVPALVD